VLSHPAIVFVAIAIRVKTAVSIKAVNIFFIAFLLDERRLGPGGGLGQGARQVFS
jgi:hypothetical protein